MLKELNKHDSPRLHDIATLMRRNIAITKQSRDSAASLHIKIFKSVAIGISELLLLCNVVRHVVVVVISEELWRC